MLINLPIVLGMGRGGIFGPQPFSCGPNLSIGIGGLICKQSWSLSEFVAAKGEFPFPV